MAASLMGFVRPMPPSLGGRARRSLSSFPEGLRRVRLRMSGAWRRQRAGIAFL